MINEHFIKTFLKYALLKFKQNVYKEILVIGDSHASVFKNTEFLKAFPNHFMNVVSIGGATVSGLKNPNSQTQS